MLVMQSVVASESEYEGQVEGFMRSLSVSARADSNTYKDQGKISKEDGRKRRAEVWATDP